MNQVSAIQFAVSPTRRKILLGGAAAAAALSLSGTALGTTNSVKQLPGGVTMQSIHFNNNDIKMAGNIYLRRVSTQIGSTPRSFPFTLAVESRNKPPACMRNG